MDYCHKCEREFRNIDAHFANSGNHNWCIFCARDFPHLTALGQHRNAVHARCHPCNTFFRNTDALVAHWREHGNHIYCEYCETTDDAAADLQTHYLNNHHYCAPCQRFFNSAANLLAHKNSKLHKPATLKCPLCNAHFGTASALTLHLEGGACPSGIKRQQVDARMRQLDTQNVITRPQIGWHDNANDDTGTLEVSNQSYDRYTKRWNCPLCSRDFATRNAVSAHLRSGVHDQAQYRCPNTECGGYVFKRLSAFLQHVESQKCRVAQTPVARRLLGTGDGHGFGPKLLGMG